jgi:hypothetical protein
MASTYLQKNTVTATDAQKFTYSGWLKRAGGINNASAQDIFYIGYLDINNRLYFSFAGGDTIFMVGKTGGSTQLNWETTRKFRDASNWYHIVVSADSTQNNQDDRLKLYVNGVQETLFTKVASPSQNFSWGNQLAQSNNTLRISGSQGGGDLFNGLMSHIHFIDGTAYDPTAFGETDATTGEWKIKTSPSVTYGNNGFFILKDGNSVTDQSGKGNNFTVGGGTLTKTEDSPSNVFATLNPLVTYGTNQNALSEGNNTLTGISYHRPSPPTISVNSGKWYFEAKALSGTSTKWWIGLCDTEYDTNNQGATSSTANYIWGYDGTTNAVNQRSQIIYGNDLRDGGSNIAISGIFSAGTIAVNDIYAMAVDLDNQKVWYSKNGVWNNGSGGESTTFNASTPDSTNIDAGRDYLIGIGGENSKWSINYGNGYFGTTAVSSAGTNASGIGIFEYDCPTGYTALSTKGLNL